MSHRSLHCSRHYVLSGRFRLWVYLRLWCHYSITYPPRKKTRSLFLPSACWLTCFPLEWSSDGHEQFPRKAPFSSRAKESAWNTYLLWSNNNTNRAKKWWCLLRRGVCDGSALSLEQKAYRYRKLSIYGQLKRVNPYLWDVLQASGGRFYDKSWTLSGRVEKELNIKDLGIERNALPGRVYFRQFKY